MHKKFHPNKLIFASFIIGTQVRQKQSHQSQIKQQFRLVNERDWLAILIHLSRIFQSPECTHCFKGNIMNFRHLLVCPDMNKKYWETRDMMNLLSSHCRKLCLLILRTPVTCTTTLTDKYWESR